MSTLIDQALKSGALPNQGRAPGPGRKKLNRHHANSKPGKGKEQRRKRFWIDRDGSIIEEDYLYIEPTPEERVEERRQFNAGKAPVSASRPAIRRRKKSRPDDASSPAVVPAGQSRKNDRELSRHTKLPLAKGQPEDPRTSIGYATMSELYEYYGKVKWSWKNYIPVGHLTMIAGVQGQGKSYFAAYIMSVWTGAQAKWPDGQKYDGPVGRVALIDTEQMRGEYVNRLRKMGVEDEDVVVPLEEQGSDDLTYSIDLTSELRTVEEMVSRLHCVGIVIDSLSGGHNLNENSDEMKQILKPLADMAARRQVPAIVIHDIRKKDEKMSNRATLDRVRGSVVITKFCRSVLGLYRPAEDLNSAVRIDVLKANFCKVPKSLGFTIGSEGLTFCKAPEEVKSMTATDYAAEFLLTQLAEGPRKIKVVRATAKADGITNYALFEAKRRLDVVTLKDKWALRTIDGKTYPVSSRAVEDAG